MADNVTRTHPLFLAAAASVVLFAAVGSAAVLGWLPASHSEQTTVSTSAVPPQPAPQPQAEPQVVANAIAPAQPKPVARKSEPQPAPVKAVKAVYREPARVARPAICADCGVVESVREVTEAGDGSGLGAVIGGVTGAVVGRQFGGGRGKDVMTVVGVLGGGVAGHQIEKRVRATTHYEVAVRFEDGRTQMYRQDTAAWQAGDRVRVIDGRLQHKV